VELLGVAAAQTVVVRVRDNATSQTQSLRLLTLPSLDLSGPLVPLADGNDYTWMTGGRVFIWRNPLTPASSPLYSVDATTLQPTAGWQPPQLSNGQLNDVAKAGSRVFLAGLGGSMTVNGQLQPVVAVLDASTGAIDATWTPPSFSLGSGAIRLLSDGTRLFMEGGFRLVSGQPRMGWIAIDATSGALQAWAPTVTRDPYRDLVRTPNFIVASNVTGVSGVRRNGLALIDRNTGSLLPADPMSTLPAADASVWTLAVNSTHVYVAIQEPRTGFATIRRLLRSSLVWDPNWSIFAGGANAGVVRALVARDDILYVGGPFSNVSVSIGGVQVSQASRNGLAAIALGTGSISDWNPNVQGVSIFENVASLALTQDRMYLAGAFTAVGGQARSGFAAVNLTDGALAMPPVAGLTAASRVVSDGVGAFALGNTGALPVLAAVSPQGTATYANILDPTRGAVVELAYLDGRVYAGRERDARTLQPTASPVRFAAAFGLSGAVMVTYADSSLQYHAYAAQVVPGAPQNLSATPFGNQVSLTWQPSAAVAPLAAQTFGAAQSYVIRAGNGTGLFNLADVDTGSLSTGLTASAPNGTYFVRVHAKNAFGLSAPSNEVRFTLGAAGCSAPPDQPGQLTAAVSGTQVLFSWGVSAGASSYVLEAGAQAGGSELGAVNVGQSLSLAAAAAPGRYYVRVRGSNACGVGPASNDVNVVLSTENAVPGPPSTPTYSLSGSTVSVSWQSPASGGAPTGYVLEAGSRSGAADLGVTPTAVSGLVATSVPPGTYYVRVRATNGAGTSEPSGETIIVIR